MQKEGFEIASPESRLRDRGEKFAEYEMGGVQEYWLIDPEGLWLKVEWLWRDPLPPPLEVLRELELI